MNKEEEDEEEDEGYEIDTRKIKQARKIEIGGINRCETHC